MKRNQKRIRRLKRLQFILRVRRVFNVIATIYTIYNPRPRRVQGTKHVNEPNFYVENSV